MIGELIKLRAEAKKSGEPILRDASFELLIKTVKEHKPKSMLEIGVNLGLSGIAMLLSSENSRLTGIEIDEEKVKLARQNYAKFGVDKRARIILGDATEVIPVLTGKYDFIFLDGPKGHYGEYVSYLLPLLSVNGILFADNVLFRGYVTGKVKTPHRFATTKHGMEKYLKTVCEDKKLITEIYDIEDGVAVTEKLSD